MSYRYEKNEIVIDGFDKGIATSPHKGIANLQGVNIATETGEVMCSFNRVKQSQTGTSGSLTQVNTNTVSISGIALQVGQVITITDAGTTGLQVPFTALDEVESLIIGGGAGGGTGTANADGGGGGAGEFVTISSIPVAQGAYSVVVGDGGMAATNGDNSTFAGHTALGGGHGATGLANGTAGGSGGGAGGKNDNVGAGHSGGAPTASEGFGHNGGGSATTQEPGGGGGAGAVGEDGNSSVDAGDGGVGLSSSISGASAFYSGGGGGGSSWSGGTGGAGGNGGGGNGATGVANGSNGTVNTGGGGGGAGGDGSVGGAGGSGIVIISYSGTVAKATGGIITTSGGKTIHTFTTSGTFTVLPSLSGDYYYLSTGKLYLGSLPPSDPDSATAVTGISSGTATFTITYPLGQPTQSATEPYFHLGVQYYRYYILDSLGNVWCHDTRQLSNWDTPVWFFVGTGGVGTSGLAVYNGWLTIALSNGFPVWKLTSLLGSAFVSGGSFFQTNLNHVMLNGHINVLYGTDGYTLTSLKSSTSLITGAIPVQSYAQYFSSLGSDLVTNGSFTGNAAGWTLTSGWTYNSNAVDKDSDGTTTLSQDIGADISFGAWLVTYTISNYSVGSVTPQIGTDVGSTMNADGTYSTYIYSQNGGNLIFTPTNTARFTIDTISVKRVLATIDVIGGSNPTTGTFLPRTPAIFFTDGTLPTAISAGTIYFIEYRPTNPYLLVYADASSQDNIDIYTGAVGNQYFDTFDPTSTAGQSMVIFSPQRLNLPFYETITCLAEIGNTVVIGTKSNTIYPWNQSISVTAPQDVLFLPEIGTVNIITVNNNGYIFTGNKGNIYLTNGSSISTAISVPDYCAGIAGTPSTYIEPYFTWGDAMFCRGRIYFSILDQTASKAGNCGGIWSFIPTQAQFISQDTGLALRLENQNSYGTYNGLATVLLPSQQQNSIGTQYWSGWNSNINSPTYGIDSTGTTPQSSVIETDLIPTGTMLKNKTFEQIEFKVSSPLINTDSISISYRQNSTDAFASCGTLHLDPSNLSGYYPINFQSGQWLQLQATLTPASTSSFCRVTEIRVR